MVVAVVEAYWHSLLIFGTAVVEHVSSAGLRMLIIMCKACPGGVTLVSPNEVVADVLEQTGFAGVLTIA